MTDPEINVHTMTLLVKDPDGKEANHMAFMGRPPVLGEAVEMVYVRLEADGTMCFKLRTVEK